MAKIYLRKVKKSLCRGCYFFNDGKRCLKYKTILKTISCATPDFIFQQFFPTPDEAAMIEARLKK